MIKQELLVIKEKSLQDCSPKEAFWSTKSQIIRNIYELIDIIDHMDDWAFRYHVNLDNNKNDFADWIRDVFGDEKLSMNLEGIMDRKKYVRILNKRVKELENLN